MNNIIKIILISLSILLVIFLIPIYTLYYEFKTPSFEIGTQNYEYNKASNNIFTSNIDDSLKTDFRTVLDISSQNVKQRIIKLLSISSYFIIIISIVMLVIGIYLLKKNFKVLGSTLTFCGLVSPLILILSGYITYFSYLNY